MAIPVKEKRNFPRVNLHTLLHYQIRGATEFNSTISNDISLGGISFVNHKFIAPKTSLSLEINVLSRILSASGMVAWSQPLAHSDRYRVGIEFLELNPGERNYLRDFIGMQTEKL